MPAPMAAATRLALAITPNPISRSSLGGAIKKPTIDAAAVRDNIPAAHSRSRRCRRGSLPTPCRNARRNSSTLNRRMNSSAGLRALLHSRLSAAHPNKARSQGISGRCASSSHRRGKLKPRTSAGRYRVSATRYWNGFPGLNEGPAGSAHIPAISNSRPLNSRLRVTGAAGYLGTAS